MSKLLLIGCGKAKQPEGWRGQAMDLYTGSIFRARRKYAEATEIRWKIISAEHGMMSPATLVRPYDRTMSDLSMVLRRMLALDIAHDLTSLHITEVEIHMGRDYAETLIPVLESVGIKCTWPVKGLSQGLQLQWYKNQIQERIIK